MYNLVLILVCVLMYARCLPYDYLIDDQLVPKGWGKGFLSTFWLQLTAQKYSNRYVEHAQRILIHAAVCVTMYHVFGADQVAFFAALLFAVNPGNAQSVAWLNGVGYSISALLVLLALAFPWLSPVFYLATLWYHVTAAPMPALYLLAGAPVLVLQGVLYAAVIILAKFRVPFGKVQDNATIAARWKHDREQHTADGSQHTGISWGKMVFVVKTFAYYFWLALFPKRLGMFHTFGYSYGTTDFETEDWQQLTPLFWCGMALIAAHVWAIVTFWGTPLAYGLAWFDLFIAPWCNLFMLQQPIAERYLYLPNVGLMYALSWALFQVGR